MSPIVSLACAVERDGGTWRKPRLRAALELQRQSSVLHSCRLHHRSLATKQRWMIRKGIHKAKRFTAMTQILQLIVCLLYTVNLFILGKTGTQFQKWMYSKGKLGVFMKKSQLKGLVNTFDILWILENILYFILLHFFL